MTYSEYQETKRKRAEIARKNTSLRMRGLPTLPLPELPDFPLVPVAYDAKGGYVGRLRSEDELPAGCHIVWEKAAY